MSEAPAVLPETIGPFRVLRAIAAGGMAEVYEVQDPRSGERFACKLLVAVKVALDRFNREYEAMTRLNHPGIVRVYHYGLHEGHPWMTMELLRGTPAQPWMKKVGKPGAPERTDEVLRIGYHLARALDYAHQRGLIHRDLKSANVLILPDGRVKLVDFGTAHLTDAVRRITGEGEFVGTYAYASPEQVSAKPIDARSDIYSLGVLYYRLATGRRPFSTNEPAALVRAHLREDPPDPRTFAPNLAPGLADLILAMMAKSPDDRPRSAAMVAQLLERIHGAPFASTSPLALHEPGCTERHLERRLIRDHLVSHAGAAVMVVGDTGSDRERVVDAVLQECIERKERVFLCTLQEGRDVDALLGMLKAMGRQGADERTAVRRLRKLARANATQLAVGRIRAGLRESVFGTLESLTGDAPIVLGVHALEHASPLTLEVLAGVRASARENGVPVSLVADCSPGLFHPGTDFSRRLPDALLVPLEPLEPGAIALAVGHMLGRRPPPAELARRLFEVTDGQATYVEDAVRHLVSSGAVEADEGNRLEWASRSVDIPLPPTARQDALVTLGELPHLHRRVLQAIALCDEEVEVEVVAEALEWEVDELSWILDDLVQRQILRRDGDVLAWRLGRLRPLLHREMPGHRRSAHELMLARQLHERAPTPAQIRLLLATGETNTAHQRCATVAREALAAADYKKAYGILLPVVERSGAPTTPLHGEIHLLFARCLQVLHPMDARATKALGVARKVMGGSPRRMAELDLTTAFQAQRIGHQAIFEKHLETAWSAAATAEDPSLKSTIALELATAARRHGQMKDCRRWVDQARSAAIAAGPAAMGGATLSDAELALRLGELAKATDTAKKALQFFQKEGLTLGYWSSVAVWSSCARRSGRYSEAFQLLADALPDAREAQDPSVYLRLLLAAAWCEVELCRLGRSQELVDEIAATVRKGELLAIRLESRLVHGRILLASGQHENAAFVLRDTMERAKSAHLEVVGELARAFLGETLWYLGDQEQSRSLFKAALLGLKGMGDRLALADALGARGRVIETSDDPDALFRPLDGLLEHEDLPIVELEVLLARARHARLSNNREVLFRSSRDAAKALNRLATRLDDTDRAALRVHPWSQRIRLGLPSGG
ncbi:MAG: protein kinase [Alphaproteobacteria bacterium]|nr:protein kinase [Alphaproteobacteria bacterium]